MGLYDRDYVRDTPSPATGGTNYSRRPYTGPGGGGGMSSRPSVRSVTFWLLVLNIGIFLLDKVVLAKVGVVLDMGEPLGTRQVPVVEGLGYFSIYTAFENFQLWRILSFQFIHANFHHIFANMLGLFFFGPMVESVLGSRRFTAYYLICGFGGVLGYMLLWGSNLYPMSTAAPLVGASAGIMGILIAAARVAPNLTVLLFLVIPLKLRTVAILALVYGGYIVLSGGPNAGGEAGHLGGAAMGALLMAFPALLNWTDRHGRSASTGPRSPQGPTASEAAEVDRILMKVGTEGMHSLTESERATLARASGKGPGN